MVTDGEEPSFWWFRNDLVETKKWFTSHNWSLEWIPRSANIRANAVENFSLNSKKDLFFEGEDISLLPHCIFVSLDPELMFISSGV